VLTYFVSKSLYDEYGKRYPELCYDILCFFTDKSKKSMLAGVLKKSGWKEETNIKCASDFATHYKDKYKIIDPHHKDEIMIQPKHVAKICDLLVENGSLEPVKVGNMNDYGRAMSFYTSSLDLGKLHSMKEMLVKRLNCFVYGFPYIYESNKVNVRPIIVKQGDDFSNGTCFNTVQGIVTARHCLDKCDAIQIEGIKAATLKSARIYGLDGIDLTLIVPQSDYKWIDKFMTTKGDVLDDVLVMGYPKHCGFNALLTATTGAIAAIGQTHLEKYELMLLTGKIKGGNSGGPVINTEGYVVGVVTESSDAQGGYDKFGYGMAIPSSYLGKLKEIKNNYNFVDDIHR